MSLSCSFPHQNWTALSSSALLWGFVRREELHSIGDNKGLSTVVDVVRDKNKIKKSLIVTITMDNASSHIASFDHTNDFACLHQTRTETVVSPL